MDLARAMAELYPDMRLGVDYELRDDGGGGGPAVVWLRPAPVPASAEALAAADAAAAAKAAALDADIRAMRRWLRESPDAPVTRGELARVLGRLVGVGAE